MVMTTDTKTNQDAACRTKERYCGVPHNERYCGVPHD